MKKSYMSPSIEIINYNFVDIVTTSIVVQDYAVIKDSWVEDSLLEVEQDN